MAARKWLRSGRGFLPTIRELLPSVLLVLLCLAMGGGALASDDASCVGCHGDQQRLRSLSPRWRDVFVDPVQYAEDRHGGLACGACHESGAYTEFPHRPDAAARRDPAAADRVKGTCGACHPEITERFLNSLHNTLEGHRVALVDLLGEKGGAARFANCTSCHASCTDCHMKQPDRYGRLAPNTASHRFARRPAIAVCKTCHGQTAETYLGAKNNPAHRPSAMAAAGLECMDCHSEIEVHGGGRRPSFISEVARPKCGDCHGETAKAVGKGKAMAPPYQAELAAHRDHRQRVSCVGCHTRWYKNCWDCHKGTTKEEGDKFYLAVDPESGEIHTAVHVPIGVEIGGAKVAAGGWAIKTRHSWGKAQTCASCHGDPAVFIGAELRQAEFVSYWSDKHAKARFVDEALVKRITVGAADLQQSPHRGIACERCHQSRANDACSGCHGASGRGRTRVDFRTTAELLELSRPAGARAAVWPELRNRYLEAGNEFHRNPRAAVAQIRSVRQDAARYKRKLDSANRKPADQVAK